MGEKSVTRASLSHAVYKEVGLSRKESASLVEQFLEKVISRLEEGETVKLSLFGSFVVRKKRARVGRNPKTGEEVTITPRRVLVFKPSNMLRKRVNSVISRGIAASDRDRDESGSPFEG
ncbi:MAG: integration host factor subunit alpha [Alphaproteobacteria bacterium]|nr:integration host factor subunit alpha [Alphaproteobacteria bacterium]